VEDVRAVLVNFYARSRIDVAVCVAANMSPPVNDQDVITERSRPFGYGESEEASAHYKQVR